tara:strand:- start:352 stop:510 length:159 start_codon:yes stop_codon:yes gene_type:complete
MNGDKTDKLCPECNSHLYEGECASFQGADYSTPCLVCDICDEAYEDIDEIDY